MKHFIIILTFIVSLFWIFYRCETKGGFCDKYYEMGVRSVCDTCNTIRPDSMRIFYCKNDSLFINF